MPFISPIRNLQRRAHAKHKTLSPLTHTQDRGETRDSSVDAARRSISTQFHRIIIPDIGLSRMSHLSFYIDYCIKLTG